MKGEKCHWGKVKKFHCILTYFLAPPLEVSVTKGRGYQNDTTPGLWRNETQGRGRIWGFIFLWRFAQHVRPLRRRIMRWIVKRVPVKSDYFWDGISILSSCLVTCCFPCFSSEILHCSRSPSVRGCLFKRGERRLSPTFIHDFNLLDSCDLFSHNVFWF